MIRCSVCLFCMTAALAAGQPSTPTIRAEQWLGPLALRPADSRTFVILFFDDLNPRPTREWVKTLNELHGRKDVVVLGVTPESERTARRFIRLYEPKFSVGVRSTSHRRLGITTMPAIRVLNAGSVGEVESAEALLERLGPVKEFEVSPDELSLGELQSRVETSQDWGLLRELRIRMDPETFVAYCDDLKARNPGQWIGDLDFQRHLADSNAPDKQLDTTPALEASRAALADGTTIRGDLTQWLTNDSPSPESVIGKYLDRLGHSRDDLVYRSDLSFSLGAAGDPKYVPTLLDMLEIEPDPAIRRRIASSIAGIHTTVPLPNRLEVAAHMRKMLEIEDNIRWARPTLELSIHLLETYDGEKVEDQ